MNPDSEDDIICLASYTSYMECPVCADDIPSGSVQAFAECGHTFCVECMNTLRESRQCPIERSVCDPTQVRTVKFKAAGHDKPAGVRKLQEEYEAALATNKKLISECDRLRARIEQGKKDRADLKKMQGDMETHLDKAKDVVSKLPQ